MRKIASVSKRFFFLAALFLFSAFFFACTKNNEQLEMPNIAPEDLSPRIEWALISDPYVACRKEASYESETIASFRKGELYEIIGNRTVLVDDTKELWYALKDGWVPSSAIRVYSNKLKAENAKTEMMK